MATPWQEISPKDSFQVQVVEELTPSVLTSLVNLYQPIIGQHALTLYLFLANQEQVEQLHTVILSTLQLGIKDFYQARIRLEGIGLLQSFQLTQGSYAYQLEPPLVANEFFETDILNALLYHQVGEQRHKQLQADFIKQYDNFSGAKNITRSFLDVYHFSTNGYEKQPKSPSISTAPANMHGQLDLSDSQFDYTEFVKSLNKQFVDGKSLQDEDVKATILMIHEVYAADALDLQQLVFEASDVQTGKVDSKALKNLAYKIYRNKAVEPLDFVEDQEIVEDDFKGLSKQEIAIAKSCQILSPSDFLKNIKLQKNGNASDNEFFALEKLVNRSPLPTAVINMLIYFILVVEGNTIIYENHINDLANAWGEEDIRTPSEAIRFTKKYPAGKKQKQRASNSRKNYNRRQKNEKLPDWAKKLNTEKDEPVDADELAAFKDRISQMRHKRKEGE